MLCEVLVKTSDQRLDFKGLRDGDLVCWQKPGHGWTDREHRNFLIVGLDISEKLLQDFLDTPWTEEEQEADISKRTIPRKGYFDFEALKPIFGDDIVDRIRNKREYLPVLTSPALTPSLILNYVDNPRLNTVFHSGSISAGTYTIGTSDPTTGTDNSGVDNKATSMTDTTTNFVSEGVSVGDTLSNTTDGCSGLVTSITTTTNPNDTLNCSGGFSGGTENDFDDGDSYSVDYSYSTLAACGSDISPPLTADLTANVRTDTTETGNILFNGGLGGFTLLFQCDPTVRHSGYPLSGVKTTLNHTSGEQFYDQCDSAGKVELAWLYCVAAIAGGPARWNRTHFNSTPSHTFSIHHNLFDGVDNTDGCMYPDDKDVPVEFYNNVIWSFSDGVQYIPNYSSPADWTDENNVIFDCGRYGYMCKQRAITLNNTAVHNTITDFHEPQNATANNCASEDGTAGTFGTSNNCVTGITDSDFEGVDDTDPTFLDISSGSALEDAGITGTLATVDIHGRTRTGTWCISASERLGADSDTDLLDGKLIIKTAVANLLDGLLRIKNTAIDNLDGKLVVTDSGVNLLDGLLLIKGTVDDLLDGKINIATEASNLLDGKINIADAATVLLDGLLNIMMDATDNLDGKIAVADTVTDLLDGKVIVETDAVDLLDGWLRILLDATNLLDGKLLVKSAVTDLLDGKVIIASIDTDLLDGKLVVSTIETAADLLDGKLIIIASVIDLLDGKIIISTEATDLLDGKIVISTIDTDTDLLDGKIIVKVAAADLLDGKIQIQTTDTDLLDGRIAILASQADLLDGKLNIYDTSTSLLDGLVIIKDAAADLLDGRLQVHYEELDLVDGKLIISDTNTELLDGLLRIANTSVDLLDGKIVISLGETELLYLDGKLIIKTTATAYLDGKIIIDRMPGIFIEIELNVDDRELSLNTVDEELSLSVDNEELQLVH